MTFIILTLFLTFEIIFTDFIFFNYILTDFSKEFNHIYFSRKRESF